MIKLVIGDVFTSNLGKFDLVYADPPYANCRFKYARKHNSRQWGLSARADFMRELVSVMESHRSKDGMCAVSMASPELRLLPLFPSNARVMPWCKTYAPHRPGVSPTYAWEPIIIWGRFTNKMEQKQMERTPFDYLNTEFLHLAPKVPRAGGHENPKPDEFAEWIIATTLGPRSGSVLELFAGSGPICRAAERRGWQSVGVDFDDYLTRESGLFVSVEKAA